MISEKTILIIDDEADFREIFSMKLSAAGYRTETAENGEEGIRKAKALKPALVLLDVQMPGMGGREVLAALRNDPDTCFSKVVFNTSIGDPSDLAVDEMITGNIGIDGYIRKTDDLEDLVSHVGMFIENEVSGRK